MGRFMTLRSFRLPAAALALVLLAGAATAQTPMDEPLDARDAKRVDRMEKVVRELRAIVFQAQSTGKPVVVQPADTDARMADLATRVDDLQQALTRVNGTIESLTHDLDVTKRENAALRDQVKALSDQSAALEQKLAAPPAAAPDAEAPAQAPPPAASAADAFAHARQLMLSGDYNAAQAAFADYVQAYPDAPKTPEARYWLGKTLSVKGAHAQAAGAYIAAIRGWPKTAWAPDAVVELSRALVALKKPADACQALGELGKRYPKAPAAVMTRAAAVRTQAKCS